MTEQPAHLPPWQKPMVSHLSHRCGGAAPRATICGMTPSGYYDRVPDVQLAKFSECVVCTDLFDMPGFTCPRCGQQVRG